VSSKRAQRRKACQGKVRYPAHGPAVAAAERIYRGGRLLDPSRHTNRPRLTDPGRVIGAKPAVFARWVFELLGAQAGDTFHDLYPGSGGITRAWHAYTTNPTATVREDQPA
jgi:hypothetical protein